MDMNMSKVQLTKKKVKKPVSPKISAEKKAKRKLISWVQKTLAAVSGIRQEIVHLWNDNYRIKYWGKNDTGDHVIRTSIFASITSSKEGFELKIRNKEEVNWSLIRREI